MRSSFLPRLLGIVFILFVPSIGVAGPTGYTGEAPVNSQSDEERVAALKTALANVVIEQTGDTSVLARSDVAQAVGQAERYVLQYSYRRNQGGDAGAASMILVAQFDSNAVERMLRQLRLGAFANMPVIPDTPSEAVIWIGGIRNAGDYTRVLGYLSRNNFVREARPVQAQGDGMRVKLLLATDLVHFLDAVVIERMLTVIPTPMAGTDAVLALAQ